MTVQKDGIGLKRYAVEYLDHDAGVKLMRKGGGDPDNDTMWDFCQQEDIEVLKPFPTKSAAMRWARKNHELDVFHMPRIRETTLTRTPSDELYNETVQWEQTGYWELDGEDIVEIEG